jgi:hypothetical protein
MFQRDILAMTRCTRLLRTLIQFACMPLILLVDAVRFLLLRLRPSPTPAAENLFLRKQLALCQERGVKSIRATDATRIALTWLARWFDWRRALAVVQPATFLRWHQQGFRLFWRWKSSRGRPPLTADLCTLIRRMARDNSSWAEERIADELVLKLGLRVSPRTVRKYLPTSFFAEPGRGEEGRADFLVGLVQQQHTMASARLLSWLYCSPSPPAGGDTK